MSTLGKTIKMVAALPIGSGLHPNFLSPEWFVHGGFLGLAEKPTATTVRIILPCSVRLTCFLSGIPCGDTAPDPAFSNPISLRETF
jgi:hypothetical protein